MTTIKLKGVKGSLYYNNTFANVKLLCNTNRLGYYGGVY